MERSLNRFNKLLGVVLALLCAPSAFGQGAYVPARSVNSNVNGVLRPVAGATITVCAAGNANVPCAPPLAGVLFKDQALTQPLANPTTTDANGNYPTMALAAGNYTITETAVGFTGFSYQITVTCGTGGCAAASLTVTGTTTLAATTVTNLTISGTGTYNGPAIITAGSCTVAAAQTALLTTPPATVDFSACTTISTNITNATGSLVIPAGIKFISGPAMWGCSISTANTPCVTVQDRASFIGVRGTNVQVNASAQKGTIIRAVAGLGSTNDLMSLNPNPVAAAEGISIDGVILDEANTAATTGRHCISAFGVSNSSIKNVWGFNCGDDGVHVEATQFHSYDLVLENVKMAAVGGQANQGTTGSSGFLLTTGATITQIVGNGTTATMTCVQLCPANGTSVTIAQNSQAGFNSTFTLTSSSGNSATFASATNATGNGGFYTFSGLTDIDRVTCTNCIYYAYNPGNNVTRFGNYGLHLLAATSAVSCTAANCGSIADTKFTGSFIQGIISNSANAALKLEAVGTVTFITQFYFQGEAEDTFQSNLGSGLTATCGAQANCSNILLETAGFVNFATQHNLSAGQGGTVWTYKLDLNPLASPEFGSIQFKPQTLTSSPTQNPDCHFALKSVASGTYCWYFNTDGTWRFARTDASLGDRVIFDGQNTTTYPASDNAYDWGGGGRNRWRNFGAYHITVGSDIALVNVFASATAPTIAAAGCGGGAASIVVSNGTAAFKINVGTTPSSACTITMPAATTGWNVTCNDITTQSASVFVQKQTGGESTTSVTITNFNTSAAATAFVASDILKCTASAD